MSTFKEYPKSECRYCGKKIKNYEMFWHTTVCCKNPKYKTCKGCKYLAKPILGLVACEMHEHNTNNCPHRFVE
jgi:hypothetical protein